MSSLADICITSCCTTGCDFLCKQVPPCVPASIFGLTLLVIGILGTASVLEIGVGTGIGCMVLGFVFIALGCVASCKSK